ncbi:MAG: aminopeptidase P N-terminal domain-containing protein [Acidobacteria bacterium]|nr:aminopeptidase P N-terminal domain-containing protein [Acidobacteriota bacterium]
MLNFIKRSRSILVLTVFLASAAAGQNISYFSEHFTAQEFTARREKVFDAIGENGVAILQGEPSPRGYVRFRQSNEFYYLTGIAVPHAYLLLDGGSRRATLYLLHRNEGRERGEGKMLSAEDGDLIMKNTGIQAVYGSDLLAEHLSR